LIHPLVRAAALTQEGRGAAGQDDPLPGIQQGHLILDI
jgi:hypothetical protein